MGTLWSPHAFLTSVCYTSGVKPALTADFVPAAEAASARPGGASLDVLRFLAAGFILLFHYGLTAPVALGSLIPVLKQGWLATDFFLILSGYVLSRAYGDRLATAAMRPERFMVRRFARLWPSHMIVLLVFAAFVLICEAIGLPPGHADHYSISAFFAQAFLVHGWGLINGPVWNVPTWTLSALLVCYVLYGLYAPLLHNRSRWLIAATAIAILAGAEFIAQTVAQSPLVDLPYRWALLRAIPLFLLGNLIERGTRDIRVTSPGFWACLATCLSCVVLMEQFPRTLVNDAIVLIALAALIAVSGAVTFRETQVTNRLGRASFSLFLTHSLVGAVWFGLTAKLNSYVSLAPALQWGLWAGGVALALITAFLFDALIDKPLSARVSRLRLVRGD